jgi:predicted glycosyltransferase
MGLGSTRRQLAIAAALNQSVPESKILLATSIDEASHFNVPANCEIIKLPALKKLSSGEYISPRLGIGGSKLHAFRSAKLLEIVRTFCPTIVLVDKHPFGVKEELSAPLEVAKSIGARIVLGLRDILDDRDAVLREWLPSRTQQRIAEYFDRILIYGIQSIFDPIKEYQFQANLSERTKFCGYVVNPSDGDAASDCFLELAEERCDNRLSVLATVGGGEDGFNLLKTFVESAKNVRWRGSVIAGPLISAQDCHSLHQLAAKNGVTLRRFSPSLSKSFSTIDAIVCMGGYNTLAESLSQGVPVVCVPRTKPRSEQLLRALAFAQLGLLRTIKPDDLNVPNLSAAVNDALQTSRSSLHARVNSLLKFDGANQAANKIINLLT